MTVSEISQKLKLNILVEGDSSRQITGGYAGDLLSWVMGRAQKGDAWITVMGNINSIAVAVLSDAACIILSEDSTLDDDACKRAEIENVAVLSSSKTTFILAAEIYNALR